MIENSLDSGLDLASVRTRARDEIGKFLFGRIRRRPMVLTVLMEV